MSERQVRPDVAEAREKLEQYLNNVWKLRYTVQTSLNGSFYFRVKRSNGDLFFQVRLSDHAPNSDSDKSAVQLDPKKDVIGSLSYIAHRFDLRTTKDIVEYRESKLGWRAYDTPLPSSEGEKRAILHLIDQYDALIDTVATAEKAVENKVIEIGRLKHLLGKAEARIADLETNIEEMQEDLLVYHRLKEIMKPDSSGL